MKILMYSRHKPPCQFCVRAKSMLDYYGVEYEEKLLDDINHLIEFKDNYPNIKHVPAIFIDDEYIGGYNELEKRLWKKI